MAATSGETPATQPGQGGSRARQDHHHHHHHNRGWLGDRGLVVALAINLGLTVVQVVGGIVAGSLALVADALHNLSDAGSLGIAYAARRIGRRAADDRMTFGYARAEIVAALVNFTTLILLGAYLAYEAVLRLLDPQPVAGWTVIGVAGVALAVDTATALLTLRQARHSMNVRAAFLHNLTDALASVAVILGGGLVLAFGWHWVDPVLTLAIAGYVLGHGVSAIGGAIRILMLGAPEDMEPREVIAAMAAEPGVLDVHHVHLWRFDERRVFLEAHLVLAEDARAAETKGRIRQRLRRDFGVWHVTLETEAAGETCQETGGVAA